MKKPSSIILKIKDDFEKVKEIIGDNIISYFDYQIDSNKKTCQIFMEYIPNTMTLKKYFKKYNELKNKNTGLPLKQIKLIIKGILSGLKTLHEQNIYPGNINPDNILVNEDLSKIKIINYALKTKNDEILTFPFYSASKKVFMKFLPEYEYENDIWSVGCITFELLCGYRPYNTFTPHDAACSLAQCISPIEAANEDKRTAFEDMCRLLFCDKFLDSKTISHSNPNNPGVEIEPIMDKNSGKMISFQSKYFDCLNPGCYTQIRHSAEKAIKHYGKGLDRIYLYCNKDLTTTSKSYNDIVSLLQTANIELELISNNSILDEVKKNEVVATYFFFISATGIYLCILAFSFASFFFDIVFNLFLN